MRSIAIAAAALLLAACSNDGAGGSTTAAPTDAGNASVATASVGDLGTVLVDDAGRTLYLFLSDTGSESTCTGTCEEAWPPLLATGDPTAGGDADAALLGTTSRPDGSTQVTYDGHPLYRYTGDEAAGDANGQGVGDVWFVVAPDGSAVQGSAGGGDDGGGYGAGGYG